MSSTCAVPQCSNSTRPHDPLCARHHKHEARVGSAYHRGLTAIECNAHLVAVRTLLRTQWESKQWNTVMMVKELIAIVHALPRDLPRLPDMLRQPPQIRAETVLYHVYRQFMEKGKQRKKSEVTFAIALLSSMMSRELVAPSICSSHSYISTQAAHSVHSRLLKVEVKRYAVETGNGRVIETVVANKRPQLQSKALVRRLYKMLAPTYRVWLEAHREDIQLKVQGGSPSTLGIERK